MKKIKNKKFLRNRHGAASWPRSRPRPQSAAAMKQESPFVYPGPRDSLEISEFHPLSDDLRAVSGPGRRTPTVIAIMEQRSFQMDLESLSRLSSPSVLQHPETGPGLCPARRYAQSSRAGSGPEAPTPILIPTPRSSWNPLSGRRHY